MVESLLSIKLMVLSVVAIPNFFSMQFSSLDEVESTVVQGMEHASQCGKVLKVYLHVCIL